MVKAMQFAYSGMMRDVAKSKHPQEYYWDAMNIKVTADEKQSAAVITNEKGNHKAVTLSAVTITTANTTVSYNLGKTKISYQPSSGITEQVNAGLLPTSSNPHKILGYATARTSVVLITSDDNGMNCIWEIEDVLNEDYPTAKLLYVRNMGLSSATPVQMVYNYENEDIEKVYWVDGQNQVRSINLRFGKDDPLLDIMNIPLEALDMVGTVSLSQPVVTSTLTGGNHTAGMIQYSYNLYRRNSSQTKFGPISKLEPLAKTSGGGDVNEVVGTIPVVQIDNIDTSYDSIKVYAIKYTSLGQAPAVSLIADREIDNNSSLTIYDDGNTISSLSLDEFAFLGSEPIVPQHIDTKDARMFFFNIKKKNFLMPENIDMRAFSYSAARSYKIMDGPVVLSGDSNSKPASNSNIIKTASYTDAGRYAVSPTYDAINFDYDTYKFQEDGTTLGGEGKYVKYQLLQKTAGQLAKDPNTYRFLKDNDLYRIAIRFYNRRGQRSLPSWIADFQVPVGNLQGNYNVLSVTLKQDFKNWVNDDNNFPDEDNRPIGFEVLIAERTSLDKMVICQGLISTMLVNTPTNDKNASLLSTQQKLADSDIQVKMPDILMRVNEEIEPLQAAKHLEAMQFIDLGDSSPLENPLTEIQYDTSSRKADTYQYTAMHQMWTPDVVFGDVSIPEGVRFHTLGGLKNTDNQTWNKQINITTRITGRELKVSNGLHPKATGVTVSAINGPPALLMSKGLIGEPNSSTADVFMAFQQHYREFSTFVASSNAATGYVTYGVPEITEKGEGRKTYNNDSKFEYKNNLQGLLTDGVDGYSDRETGITERAIINVNSDAARNLTFVLGSGNSSSSSNLRTKWETLHSAMSLGGGNNDTAILGEFRRPAGFRYIGNLYGGNNYEAKKRSSYIPIGQYTPLAPTGEDSVEILSPGDTYVGTFRFERISPTETEIYSPGHFQYSELVEFPVETSIDLKNRNDVSNSTWDSRFQPDYDEYHKYNTVYSQPGDLITTTDLDYNLNIVEEFDTRVQASKLKIPNETIDSWTDVFENETMDLDGKYGPINAVVNFRDNLYALQEEAVALLSINPRVTVASGDGIPTELGTGNILNDYNYVTTKSGTINKWSVVETLSGFYYFDLYNRTWMRFTGNSLTDLFDAYGMNSFIRGNQNILYNFVAQDNPIIGKGATAGYDLSLNTVYLSLLQTGKDWTLSFNERTNSFVSFHSYVPAFYIRKGKLLFTSNNGNELWLQNSSIGEWNKYYGTKDAWHIVLEANPQEPDCVFNNLEFKAECYKSGVDQPNTTFSNIQVYNDYQDTGNVALSSDNLSRKFRVWRIQIPRDQVEIMDRIRGHWAKIKLSGEQTTNLEHVIHNIVLYYSAYP